jgi:hypothetical protein
MFGPNKEQEMQTEKSISYTNAYAGVSRRAHGVSLLFGHTRVHIDVYS